MKLVILMLCCVVLGFIVGALCSDFLHVEKRTSTAYIKVGIAALLVIVVAAYCISKGFAYVLSLGLGLVVGLAPYVPKKNEEAPVETKDEESQE